VGRNYLEGYKNVLWAQVSFNRRLRDVEGEDTHGRGDLRCLQLRRGANSQRTLMGPEAEMGPDLAE